MAMERENRPARGAGKRRKKVCQFCVDKCECIDYKDAAKLRRFISDPAPPHHRHLRHAPASADRGHQARPSDRAAALRDRVIPARSHCSTKKTCRKAGLFLHPDRPFSSIYHAFSPL